jgi:hypothetical protein
MQLETARDLPNTSQYNGWLNLGGSMLTRLFLAFTLAAVLVSSATAKDKNKSSRLPEYVLRAPTVLVVIEPDAGEPIDQPRANAIARENVEKALMEWGRYQSVMDGEESDLIVTVRTASRAMRPTMKGGPIDRRPGVGQSTDSSIRIGAQRGQPPPLSDPSMDPRNPRPRMSNEIGPSEDMLAVYRGGLSDPLDVPPVWRYIAKDSLRAPQVTAVEEFRKAVAEAEKPQTPKQP